MRKIIRSPFADFATMFAVLVWLGGCGRADEVNVSLSGINYTDAYISSFVVNGYDGANIFPHIAGGSYVCCMSVPRRWRPGLVVTIRWTKDSSSAVLWKQTVVNIPEYKSNEIGFLAVHFYPNDVVKVLVTNKSNRYPGYPYPEPTLEK